VWRTPHSADTDLVCLSLSKAGLSPDFAISPVPPTHLDKKVVSLLALPGSSLRCTPHRHSGTTTAGALLLPATSVRLDPAHSTQEPLVLLCFHGHDGCLTSNRTFPHTLWHSPCGISLPSSRTAHPVSAASTLCLIVST